MTRVVIEKLSSGKAGRSSAVTSKRVSDAGSGGYVTIRSVNANSKTLGADLQDVFSKNVAKARKENKEKFGSADRVSAKK